MRKRLSRTEKNKSYLECLPKIYLVSLWAKHGVKEFPFSGKYEKRVVDGAKISIPLVYQYDDHNGADDAFYLRPIDCTTSGIVKGWFWKEGVAQEVANGLNKLYDSGEPAKKTCPICGGDMDETYHGRQYCYECSKKYMGD